MSGDCNQHLGTVVISQLYYNILKSIEYKKMLPCFKYSLLIRSVLSKRNTSSDKIISHLKQNTQIIL